MLEIKISVIYHLRCLKAQRGDYLELAVVKHIRF